MRKLIIFFIAINTLTSYTQEKTNLILVEEGNITMEKAFYKAKQTLDSFIEKATISRSENNIYGAYVKVSEEETVEYLWVSDFKKYDDEYFIGVLISSPELIKQFKNGATIGFRKEDIYDWQIYNKLTDKLEGAYTFEVLENKKL